MTFVLGYVLGVVSTVLALATVLLIRGGRDLCGNDQSFDARPIPEHRLRMISPQLYDSSQDSEK